MTVIQILKKHGFDREDYALNNETDDNFAARIVDAVFTWATKSTSNLEKVSLMQDLTHTKDLEE